MFTEQDNVTFDRIVSARQSCRKFLNRLPERNLVSQVIEAGNKAPYAIASAKDVETFRHFYVLYQGHQLLPAIHQRIREQSGREVEQLRCEMGSDPVVQMYGEALAKMRALTAQEGMSLLENPPCLIVLAEWRGARRAEKQDLAHALENMWLKATALNMGMVIISLFEGLTDDQVFCDMLGLPVGKYGFHACVLGYPKNKIPKAKRVTSQTHWL